MKLATVYVENGQQIQFVVGSARAVQAPDGSSGVEFLPPEGDAHLQLLWAAPKLAEQILAVTIQELSGIWQG